MSISTVEAYIEKFSEQRSFLKELRRVLQDLGFEEHIKWGAPVYSYNGQNLIALVIFKKHTGIWFFEGALLSDPLKKLSNSREGKTRAMRHWKILHTEEPDMAMIKWYFTEAIELAKAGKKVKKEKTAIVEMPVELASALKGNADLNQAFQRFTPGLQKEFMLYLQEAKQDKTKVARLQKIIPMILNGKGLNDKYRK